jgi:hypothetical protein
MFMLYRFDGCNLCELVLHKCYVNDCVLQHVVVCWVTTLNPPEGDPPPHSHPLVHCVLPQDLRL